MSGFLGFGPVRAVVLTLTSGPYPANDAYAKRAALSGSSGTVSGTNAFSSLEAGEPFGFATFDMEGYYWRNTTPSGSVWYK